MTINSDTKVTTIAQMQNAIKHECGSQIAKATEAALAVPLDPRRTYRARLLRAVIAVAPDCSEHLLFAAWRGDRTLEPLAQALHHAICGMRFDRLAEPVNHWAAEEIDKEETYRLRLAR
jgi:hypothetical protein